MTTASHMINYDDTEEADGLDEYYGKAEEEMAPQEAKHDIENKVDELSGNYSDSKENRRDSERKHSKSHRSKNHKKPKDNDSQSDQQEQKQPKKVKKEEQVLQDQSAQKNSPKVGEPLIGEDGEILEDGEIASDQEGEAKIEDDDGEVNEEEEGDNTEGEEKEKEDVKEDGSEHDKKDKRKRKRDRHRDQSSKRRRSKEDGKDKQKKKKRHHDYKDYDKVEDDYQQGWVQSKDDQDKHGGRSPPTPYDSPDEDHQEFGSPRGDKDRRRRPSADRRFNNNRSNRNRGRGGRNSRGRDHHRDRDRGRDRDRDRDKDRGDKRRNSGDRYSPPGPYDSPSDEDYDGDNKYRGRKPKTLMSMVEGEYLDPSMTTNENERLQHNKSKKKKRQDFRDRQQDRENEDEQPVKKKPLLQTPMEERPICRFFKEGKCQKGGDCPFNHDYHPDKKALLCKYYLISHCRNENNCIYMHSEFPCKYFHTGSECYQGDKCKFSHDPLTEETDQALQDLLDGGRLGFDDDDDHEEKKWKRPSLLGSPPREQEDWVKERLKGIPSIFDIATFAPGQSPRKPQPNSQAQPSPPVQRPQGFYSETNMSPQTGPNQMRFNGPNQGTPPRGPFMPGQQGPGMPGQGMPFPGQDMQGPPGLGMQGPGAVGMQGPGMPGPGMQGNPMGPNMNQAAALVGALLRAAPMLQQQMRGPMPQGPPTSMGNTNNDLRFMGQQGPPTSGPGGMMMGAGPGGMMMGPGPGISNEGPVDQQMMGQQGMATSMSEKMGDPRFMGQQNNMGMGQNFGGMDSNNMNSNTMDPRLATSQSTNLDTQDMDIENSTDAKDTDFRSFEEPLKEEAVEKVEKEMGDTDLRTDTDMREVKKEEVKEESQAEATNETESETKPDNLGFEIPSHLPKKQREMFIRIQQQQLREKEKAEREKNAAKETEEKAAVKEENDNWSYSSDEEEDQKPNISNILKSLSSQGSVKRDPDASQSPLSGSGGSSSMNVMQMINAIKSQSSSTPTSARQGDPRQPDHVEPPKLPVPSREPTIIHSREGECPYRMIKVLYVKQRIPTNVSLSDSKFKNDPRVQKMLRQQELESGIVIDHSAAALKQSDPRVKTESETKFPLLDAIKKEPSLPRPELTPFVDPRSRPELTPFVDPRIMKSENSDPRIKSENTDSRPVDPRIKNVTDVGNMGNRPMDPRLQRMQSNQGMATHNMPGMGLHNLPIRPMDPRLARQDSNSSTGNRPVDPRLGRQNSRDMSNLGGSPSDPRMSKQVSSSEIMGDPRLLGRQTSDPRLSSLDSSSENSFSSNKPMDPRLGRLQDTELGPPSIHRQHSQPSTIAEKNSVETKTEAKPKIDYRNDPRFKRKHISESNLSPSSIGRRVPEQRKSSTEYNSPLSGESSKLEESGYNSYNKPRPQKPASQSSSAPKLQITPDMVPKASEDISTHDILDSLKMSPPVMDTSSQSDKHLKDIFKTIDPTASPFC